MKGLEEEFITISDEKAYAIDESFMRRRIVLNTGSSKLGTLWAMKNLFGRTDGDVIIGSS